VSTKYPLHEKDAEEAKKGWTHHRDAPKCDMACSLVTHKSYTFLLITPLFPGGLRAWNTSLVSMDCGLRMSLVQSAPDSNVCRATMTAAAGRFYFVHPISPHTSPNLKKGLLERVISVIFILNFTVS